MLSRGRSEEQMTAVPPARARPIRRHELDWLRTFAVLGLIPFHAAVIFTTGSMDYVKNAETSRGVDIFVSFISIWGMPLIFLIAGAGARFALQMRTPWQFLRERFSRLVIPFLFGMIAIVPLQVYIGLIARGGPLPAAVPFYVDHLMELLRVFTGVLPRNPQDFIGHLWFIPMLIVFEALALPLDWFFHTAAGGGLLRLVATHANGMMLLGLFGLLFGATRVVLGSGLVIDAASQSVLNWSLLSAFLLAYVLGYVIYADNRLEAAMRTVGLPALLLACPAWVALEAISLTPAAARPSGLAVSAAYLLLSGYTSWLWLAAIVSYGMRYLTRSSRPLRYLDEAAYPAYVLHMPILSLIALFVVRWDLPLLAKLVIITLTTLAATLGVYDLLVKRFGVIRRLFGLKPRPPRKPPRAIARAEAPSAEAQSPLVEHAEGAGDGPPVPAVRTS